MKTTLTLKQKLPDFSQPSWLKFINGYNFFKQGKPNLLIFFLLFTFASIPSKPYAQASSGLVVELNVKKFQPKSTDESDLNYSATSVNVLCGGESTGSITGSVSGGVAPYEFSINTGAFGPDNVFSGLAAGDYTIHVKDANDCEKTTVVTITEPGITKLTAPSPLPACGSTGNQLSAADSPTGFTYNWTVTGAGWIITEGQGTSEITYTAGHDDATFNLIVVGDNSCQHTCKVTFGIGSCVKVEPFCSQAQEFYGQSNGVACSTGEEAAILIPRLLGPQYGNLIIGKPGHSLTITQQRSNYIIRRMSSGGSSEILPIGNQAINDSLNTSIPLNKTGRFTNALLGQTIALGLNMRLDSALAALVIPGTSFSTMAALPGIDVKCGTKDDVPHFGSVINNTFPSSVFSALTTLYSTPTITYLFDLANRALGGQYTGGASLADINLAVSAINQGFDGCRFLMANPIQKITGENTKRIVEEITMKAFPNPFEYSTTIEFVTKSDINVIVSVYNIAGEKVIDLFDGISKAGVVNRVIFKGEDLPNGIYIYKIPVGDKVYFDRLVLQK